MKSNTIIAIATTLTLNESSDPIKLGEELVALGIDTLVSGGFFIWDIMTETEFYSPNFRKTLGFVGEKDFPSSSNSWQKHIDPECKEICIDNFHKTLIDPKNNVYKQKVTYTKKNGCPITVNCSGLLVKQKGFDKFLIGTHEILKDDHK